MAGENNSEAVSKLTDLFGQYKRFCFDMISKVL